ncbi:MAG: YesL family protein [Eubacterium sp.]|nr:YesL family protein [Eubacterium sp.]
MGKKENIVQNTEQKKQESTVESVVNETEVEAPVPMTKVQKFIAIFDKFGDLFVLNIVFFVTCLPIITIGSAFTALYTVTNKMVKNTEGPVIQEYIKAFKANLKSGIAIWLVDIVYLVLMFLQYEYVLTHRDQLEKILFIAVGFEFILFSLAFPLQFPLVARYENTTLNMVRNALVLAFAHPGVWFKMYFIWMFPVALYYLKPAWIMYTWYLWIMILVALFAYACSMFLEKFYVKIEEPRKQRA